MNAKTKKSRWLTVITAPCLVVAALFIVTGCSSNMNKDADSLYSTTLKMGEITEIKEGKTLDNSQYGLSLCFESVGSDSRCPIGGVCCTAGSAAIQLHLTTPKGKYDFIFEISGGGSCSEGVVIEGIKYRLIDLLPYPVSGEEQSVKIARILVSAQSLIQTLNGNLLDIKMIKHRKSAFIHKI